MSNVNEVAIFYHYIPHYRNSVFEKLKACEDLRFNIYSDNRANLPGLKVCGNEIKWKWVRIKNYWLGKKVLFQPAIIKNALLGKEKTVIYLGTVWFISTWIATIVARLRGKKVLMWTHGILRPERGIKGLLRYNFYRLANGLLLYGHKASRLLADSGYPKDKMYIIYNSLDFEYQKKIADTITVKSRKAIRLSLFHKHRLPILLTLGRMVKRVDYPLLLKAVKHLHEAGYPVNALIIGDGPEYERVKSLVTQYNLNEYVNLYGSCHDEAILGHLINASDITIGPGSIGLACIHSLVYGTPVFSHDDPYSKQGPEFEVVKVGVNGGIFKKGDSLDCALKLKEWLEKKTDREDVEKKCKGSMLPYYTPTYQAQAISQAILSIEN